MIRAFHAPWTRVERIGLVVGLALAAALMAPLRETLTDGTFVHLQYARHLAQGEGLVFNRGERVYGTTSPLWVALLADGIGLGLDGLLVARVLGAITTLASVALFLQIMRRTVQNPAMRALATVTWSAHAGMSAWSVSGLETPLAVALTLAGFAAFTEGRLQWGARPVRTGALWGLACLARPELVLLTTVWAMALIVDAQNRDGIRRMAFGILPPAAIYGAWLAFAKVYFGTLWPPALTAPPLVDADLSTRLVSATRQLGIVGATDGVLLVVLALAAMLARRRVFKRPLTAVSLVPWMWIVLLPAFYVARGIEPLSRHLLLVMPVIAWLAWHAAERWWRPAGDGEGSGRRVAVLAAIVAAVVIAQNLAVHRSAVVPEARATTQGLTRGVIAWGRWLGEHAPADALVATPDVGAIAWFSGRRVLDLSGDVTPRMIPILEREEPRAALARLAFSSFARPDFVVDRAARKYDLRRRSVYARCFVPLGATTAPDPGNARGRPVAYSFYRVDWDAFDRMMPRR